MKKIIWTLLAIMLIQCVTTAQSRNILILNSYGPESEWIMEQERGIKAKIAGSGFPVQTNSIYLDLKLVRDKDKYLAHFKEMIRLRTDNNKPDAVICTDAEALTFISEVKSELFPDAYIIFSGYSKDEKVLSAGLTKFAGIFVREAVKNNIELAIKYFPETSQLAFVHDQTYEGKMYASDAENLLVKYPSLNFYFISNQSMALVQTAVRKLPANTVIIMLPFNYDPSGEYYSDKRSAELVARHSGKAVLGLKSTFMGSGILGGYVMNAFNLGSRAAETALRLLKGSDMNSLNLNPDYAVGEIYDEVIASNFNIKTDSKYLEKKEVKNIEKQHLNRNIIILLFSLFAVALIAVLIILRKKINK